VAVAFQYVNTSVDGTLSAGINSTATSISLTSTPTGYPNPATAPFRLVLDIGTASEEIVTVTAGNGTSGTPWTIVRAQDGTTGISHATSSTVGHRITAGDENLSRVHESLGSGSGVHGLPAGAWATAAVSALDELTFSTATPSVTWSSIPATYEHLLVIVQGKFTEATQQSDSVLCTLNGDATAKYSWVANYTTNVSGASTGALFSGQANASAASAWPLLRMGASQAGAAANAGGGWAIIPNYTSTTFNKGFYSVSGAGDGTTAFVDQRVVSGWYNPATQTAVSSITLTAPGSSNFITGSFVGLYGVS
jgi:hypothetical protein